MPTQTKHTQGQLAFGIETNEEQAQLILEDGSHFACVECDPTLANASRLALCWNLMPEVESLIERMLAFEQRLKACPMDGGTLLCADARAILAKVKGGE